MNADKFQKKANEMKTDILNTIVGLMDMNDVKLISFATNGNYSDFNVDRSYAFVDNNDIVSSEIIAVYNNNGEIYILCDDDSLEYENIDILERNILFKDSTIANELFENMNFITLDETFAPFDTALQLIGSIEETLDCVEN